MFTARKKQDCFTSALQKIHLCWHKVVNFLLTNKQCTCSTPSKDNEIPCFFLSLSLTSEGMRHLFLHVNADEMNYVIHQGITGIHTVIQITSQILLRLFLATLFDVHHHINRTLFLMSTNPPWNRPACSDKKLSTVSSSSSPSVRFTPSAQNSDNYQSRSFHLPKTSKRWDNVQKELALRKVRPETNIPPSCKIVEESNRTVPSSSSSNQISNTKDVSQESMPTIVRRPLQSPSGYSQVKSKTDNKRGPCHGRPTPSKIEFEIESTVSAKKNRHRRKNRCPPSTTEVTEHNATLIAAGQHGVLRNAYASTDGNTPENSFTLITDSFPKGIAEADTTTRVVGTSIQAELLSGLFHFPRPRHRSISVQADGIVRRTPDTKALFQRLLPRISALSDRRKGQSLNHSGRSSDQDLYSSSRSSQFTQSDKMTVTSVDIQYSGNKVKAISRVSHNLHSKSSSHSTAVKFMERATSSSLQCCNTTSLKKETSSTGREERKP